MRLLSPVEAHLRLLFGTHLTKASYGDHILIYFCKENTMGQVLRYFSVFLLHRIQQMSVEQDQKFNLKDS